jgi:hypothetical protein
MTNASHHHRTGSPTARLWSPQEYEMERVESGADIETALSPWRVRCRLHTELQILGSKFKEHTPNTGFFGFDMSGNRAGYIRSLVEGTLQRSFDVDRPSCT